jgi:hypothetical protein
VVLLILGVVWVVYLATWWMSRAEQRGANSIATFSRHLSVLERTSPARTSRSFGSRTASSGRPIPLYPAVGAGAPSPRPVLSRAQAQRRRANVLFALIGAALFTLVLVPFVGTAALFLHLLVDVALAGYVVMLARARKLRDEQRHKVRFLPGADADLRHSYAAMDSTDDGDDGYWLESAR